jgi:transcription termination factor Rho
LIIELTLKINNKMESTIMDNQNRPGQQGQDKPGQGKQGQDKQSQGKQGQDKQGQGKQGQDKQGQSNNQFGQNRPK